MLSGRDGSAQRRDGRFAHLRSALTSKGYRGQRVKLSDRLAGIDANLDDVQAGAEACSRAVDTLVADTSRRDGQLTGRPGQALTNHVKDF
jgi:hypothetical protein